MTGVVLPDVDQWILLGKLPECDVEPRSVVGVVRRDNRLQRRRVEVVLRRGRTRGSDRVADPDLGKTPELPDLAGRDRHRPRRIPAVEDVDPGHLGFDLVAKAEPIACPDSPGEHADVGDLLTARTALDLEDQTGDRTIGVAFGRRQQLCDAGHQRLDTRASDCRAEEDGMDERLPGLGRQCIAHPVT